MTLRAIGHGGGVQTTALLVLAAQRRVDFDLFLFANVGDDSESKATLRYVREVAVPYAEANGIELVELHRVARHEHGTTLLRQITRAGSRSIEIPVRIGGGGPGQRRCSSDFKIKVVARELKRRGATADDPAVLGIGISTDEFDRARDGVDKEMPWFRRVNPLLEIGLRRKDCHGIITGAGLPTPPRSACWFCPMHNLEEWRQIKRDTPDDFAAAVALERQLGDRRVDVLGKDRCYFTSAMRPLDQVIDDQLVLDGMGGCDGSTCFT